MITHAAIRIVMLSEYRRYRFEGVDMSTPRSTRADKQAETRRRVLDAAATVFPERGFHRATVEQVAARAGLSTGAIYSSFKGKADLFLALYERQMDRWVSELESLVGIEGDLSHELRAATNYWLSFREQERDWFVLHMEFWAHVMRYPPLLERYSEQFGRLRAATARSIERAATRADVALPLSADELARLVQAVNRGLLVDTYADPGGFDSEAALRLVEAVLTLFEAKPQA
jgi:AcrR family transcriptional regulator